MSWQLSVQRERDRLDAQHSIDAAQDRFNDAEHAFFMAALNHCADCGVDSLPVHEWPSYVRMHNAHRAYEGARRELDNLT